MLDRGLSRFTLEFVLFHATILTVTWPWPAVKQPS
jgi:hypothetical protein